MHTPDSIPRRPSGARNARGSVSKAVALTLGLLAAAGAVAGFWLLATIGTATKAMAADGPLQDKTLVAWVAPANLTQRGGSTLTLDDLGGHFDGIVFGELAPAKWMAGSEFYRRTMRNQESWPAETATPAKLVQIAITYRGRTVTTYHDGAEYSRHEIADAPVSFGPGTVVMIGPRHIGNRQFFAGAIEDARIYDAALTAQEIAALRPDTNGGPAPWAWWSFDEKTARERTGRFPQVRLQGGAKVEEGRLILNGQGAALFAAVEAGVVEETAAKSAPETETPARAPVPAEQYVLNYHLMHPGGDSVPGDPNAAFCIDGVYHLHYILGHPWNGKHSFSFVHVTSPDMLHWTWQPTQLQPSFTGHGMFSGTGFLTKEGRPAAIYHGESSGRNQIAIAKDNQLSAWEKPYPVEPKNPDGTEAKVQHWDPDCFLIGDTYYSISGGENPPLFKSQDLKNWTVVGPFLQRDLPDVAIGEDISCPNFFPIGDKWMLLCISHDLGCRYYLGDWDAKAEQFVPERHGRMNFRRDGQSLFGRSSWRVDYFAPESVKTPDGRRVMWSWLATLDRNNGHMDLRTIQSLPRELSLAEDGSLRIQPLRELESLRHDPVTASDIALTDIARDLLADKLPKGKTIAQLPGEAAELRITIPRREALRKLFGITLFADGQGGGLPIIFRPETGALRVGTSEAPFAIADLPENEDIELRIFVDRYLVEVFANGRQALIGSYPNHTGKLNVEAFTIGAPTTFKTVDVWKLHPTNQGFREAQTDRKWEPATSVP